MRNIAKTRQTKHNKKGKKEEVGVYTRDHAAVAQFAAEGGAHRGYTYWAHGRRRMATKKKCRLRFSRGTFSK